MRLPIGLGLTALVALAPFGALAQRPPPWIDIRCADMPMTAEGVARCQARSPDSGRAPAQGQAIEYLARGGPAGSNGRELVLWLLWFHDDWVYRPYGPELSESIIRSHIQPAMTGGARNWGARQSFGGTVFLTFEVTGRKCVGFDHAAPLTRPRGADAAGPPWLLRGLVCERRAGAFEAADVEALLRGIRLAKGGQVDALGGREEEAAMPMPAASAGARPENAAPLALTWEDVTPLASGTLTFADEARSGGSLSFLIPDAGVRCTGLFKQRSGGPDTTELPAGTWAVSCPRGDAASGSWRADTPTSGSGEGQDSLGRRVTIRFGG